MILFKVNSKSSNFCNWFIKNAFQFLGIAALAGFTLLPISSCSDDYDDSEIKDRLDKVEDKVTELEEWCSTVNNEIASLKRLITALENNDYVTGVETLENGYKITFSKSGSITIHNGKDGADGEDGKDGYTPIIGVDKYSDGLYYWTIQVEDGKTVWLTDADGDMIRTTGDDGKDGEDGEDGNDGLTPHIGKNGNWWIGTTDTGIKARGETGNDGLTPYVGGNGNWWIGDIDTGVKAQGETGNDAPTPMIKTGADLGNGYIRDAVYLSVDNGENWIEISGDKGEQGDSFFKGIDISNEDYVIFTLKNGAPIKIAKWSAINQDPVPTGIIILDYSPATIVKGDRIKVKLRINPSGFKVTKENIELDAWYSDTYFLEDGKSQTRASYVTPSDYYELVNIEPDKNEKDEELEGQWIATIQSKGTGYYRNLSELSFVVNYTDMKGNIQQVSCLYSIPIETVPTVNEGVAFSYSKVQTIYAEENTANPYIVFIDPHTYRNSQNKVWRYKWDFITHVDTEQNDEELTADIASLYDGHYISFMPNLNNAIWEGVKDNIAKKASSLVNIKLMDSAGNHKELELPITYCPSDIELKLNLSATEVNKYLNGSYFINIGKELEEYGLTQDFMSNLSITALFGGLEVGWWDEFPLLIDGWEIINENKEFEPVAEAWVTDEVNAGMETPEDEIATVSIDVTSTAQESTTVFSLVSLKIKLPIMIVDTD